MPTTRQTLTKIAKLAPQSKLEAARGFSLRRTRQGLPVTAVHYFAHPFRDPEHNPAWREDARKGYSSQASWDREQEIVDEAGGGELVFAPTLRTWWHKIVITSPSWQPSPHWKVVGGFDHGKTNPTALLKAYVDFDGNIYLCGEYYCPGREVWQNAPHMLRMPDAARFDTCFADPSIFYQTQQQSNQQKAKAVNDLYLEEGVDFLSPFAGNRDDLTFAARLMLHWSNLDRRDPTLFIVCRNFAETIQPGLHSWDCPNLLWELLRTRKEKFSAHQLMQKNPSERIVDKENHARDALKYLVMSLPEPAARPLSMQIREKLEGLDPTSAMIRYADAMYEAEGPFQPAALGRRGVMLRNRYRRLGLI